MNTQTNLSWDNVATRKPWSAELMKAIQEHKVALDAGHMDGFIPGYQNLSADLQVKCWAEFVIAIARFESDWNPHAVFHEPPPLGVDSVGLLQLSYEDQPNYHLEPLNRAQKSLEDPLVNIRCGLVIMAHVVEKDGVVAGEFTDAQQHKKYKGAARYWSVLREGPKHHLNEIKTLTKKAVGL